MSTWVKIFDRIISCISETVEVNRITGIRYQTIRLDPPSQRGVEPSCPIVVQSIDPAQAALLPLPGISQGRGCGTRGIPDFPPRLIPQLGIERPAAVGGDRG